MHCNVARHYCSDSEARVYRVTRKYLDFKTFGRTGAQTYNQGLGSKLTKHFIKFGRVETNEVVRSNSNVILTRQTYGYHSNRVAGSKSRALAFCFSIRIWYMFLISIFQGMSDLGVRMTSVLAKRMPPHGADFRFKIVFCCRIRRRSVCERIPHMNESSYE